MSEETVKNLLRDIGLTDRETEVYIFLSKHGTLKGLEITKLMKKHKAQIYNILKNLQSKGLVEPSLEFPTRFSAVPLETAIDLNIKAKREAAVLIEKTKKEILEYWKTISRPEQSTPLERFVVIDGGRIYPKFAQMIKDTQDELSIVLSVQDMLHADQCGVFKAAQEHPVKSHIQWRFLTECSYANAKTLDNLLNRFPPRVNFQGRSPDLGLMLNPRMVMRDKEEILLFVSPEKPHTSPENDLCLWTNCKALVQSFSGIFEDLWLKSRDIKQKILENQTGKLACQRHFIFNREAVEVELKEALRNAQKSVAILASHSGLSLLEKNVNLKELANKPALSLRFMAPVASQNLNAIQNLHLLKSQLRFVADGDFTSILIDGRHFFQLGNQQNCNTPSFDSYLYTDDLEYVEKAKVLLENTWRNAALTPMTKLDSVKETQAPPVNSLPFTVRRLGARTYGSVSYRLEEYEEGLIPEKQIIDEMIAAKRIQAKDPAKDITKLYGSVGHATIHSPSYFELPDFMLSIWHCNKQSTFGAEDSLTIYLWQETSNTKNFVPVAHVTDSPKAAEFRKGVYAKTPAGKNSILLRKDQLQIRVQGNTLFAGWTLPIPLDPPQYVLPPCCVLFEGYGGIKTGSYKTILPSGKTQLHKFNRMQALVTLFHQSSEYSSSGYEGTFDREHIMTAYPPNNKEDKN